MSTISRTYLIEFPLELVFSKWVAEDTVVSPTERLEIEPRIGGTYKLFMNEGSVMEGVWSAPRTLDQSYVRFSSI